MKKLLKAPSVSVLVTLACLFTLSSSQVSAAGTSTWAGGGIDSRWTTSANWINPPSGGESLIFTGTTRLSNTNSFTVGTIFTGVTFSSPAGGFGLFGNSFVLNGGITNNQVVTT